MELNKCNEIMELKDFIKTAIADITEAVSELQDSIDNGAIINPTLPCGTSSRSVLVDNKVRVIEDLNFDVAVTATEATGIEGGAKVGISIFGAKVGTGTNAKTENVSRLTFSIPIVLPSTYVKTWREAMRDNRPKRPDH